MSLFTKIRESRRARKQRRLAAKLHKMIEAAAAENDGTLALQCDMILQGDMFARGDIGTRKTMHAGKGIHTDSQLSVDGNISVNGRARLRQDLTVDGHVRSGGSLLTLGNVIAIDDVTAYAYTYTGKPEDHLNTANPKQLYSGHTTKMLEDIEDKG